MDQRLFFEGDSAKDRHTNRTTDIQLDRQNDRQTLRKKKENNKAKRLV